MSAHRSFSCSALTSAVSASPTKASPEAAGTFSRFSGASDGKSARSTWARACWREARASARSAHPRCRNSTQSVNCVPYFSRECAEHALERLMSGASWSAPARVVDLSSAGLLWTPWLRIRSEPRPRRKDPAGASDMAGPSSSTMLQRGPHNPAARCNGAAPTVTAGSSIANAA